MTAQSARRASWAAFAGLAALYLACLCPSYGPGDSAQHLLSAAVWGVPRPPGYPLYTALAHLFFAAFGPWGVSAFSALGQAGAAALLLWTLTRQGLPLPAGLAACLLLALSPLYRFYAQIPEVRGLNDVLAAGACAAAVLWVDRRKGAHRLLGLVLGLGLSHHPTFPFALPTVLLLAAGRRPTRQEALETLTTAGLFLLLPYLALYLRLTLGGTPAYNPEGARGLGDLLGLWLRRGTGGFFSAGSGAAWQWSASALARQVLWLLETAWEALTPLGCAAALAGLVLGLKRAPRVTAAWALLFLLPGLGYAALASQQLHVKDVDYQRAMALRFFLLPLLGAAALCAEGLRAALQKLPKRSTWVFAALAAATAFLRPVCLRGHEPLRRYAEGILAATGPADLLILDSDDTVFALLYAERAQRSTGDRVLLFPWLFRSRRYIAELTALHPTLNLPREPKGPLTLDWERWRAANPGRVVWAEASLDFGGAPGAPKPLPRPRTADGPYYPFTQELYLMRLAGAS